MVAMRAKTRERLQKQLAKLHEQREYLSEKLMIARCLNDYDEVKRLVTTLQQLETWEALTLLCVAGEE